MATYKIKTNKTISVKGIPIHKGLSVEVMTFLNNPYNEMDKINSAFKRIHGVDFESEGLLTPSYFQYELVE